jgi:hypothetical protein
MQAQYTSLTRLLRLSVGGHDGFATPALIAARAVGCAAALSFGSHEGLAAVLTPTSCS